MGILDKIKSELFTDEESDTKPKPVAKPYTTTPVPNVIPTVNPTVQVSSIPMGGQPDQTVLKMVEDQVMIQTIKNRPSRYMTFLTMWNALGQPNIATSVFAALQVTDKDNTPENIKADYDQHVSLLEQSVKNANAEFDATEQNLIGEINTNIENLNKQNADAEATIAKLQSDIASRNMEIAAANNKKAETQTKIVSARQKTSLAQETVRGQLTAMSRFFN